MCKVFMITNTTMLDTDAKEQLVRVVKANITKHNSDGFGFAGVDETGEYYGFKTIDYNIEYEPTKLHAVNSGAVKTGNFLYFGDHSQPSDKGMIFHGRTSTNKSGIKNAHPVMLNDTCLIHNGVVNSSKKMDQVLDTDTELLCHTIPVKYKNSKIEDRMLVMKKTLEETITGYYAFFNLNKDGSIIVVRDDIATLYMADIEELGSTIVATTASLITEICADMKWTLKSIYEVSDNIIFRLTPENEIKNVIPFKPLGYTFNESYWSNLSLGRKLDDNPYHEDFKVQETHPETIKGGFDVQDNAIEWFLEDLDQADSSWTFTHKGNSISLQQFRALSTHAKLSECDVFKCDGAQMVLENYIEILENNMKDEQFDDSYLDKFIKQ